MLSKKLAGALASLALMMMYSTPASSQLVLSCYTLHNDLVNFDRRARAVRPYFMPELESAKKEAERALRYSDRRYCFDWPTEKCAPRSGDKFRKTSRYQELKNDYLLSHLGGADPVRLRIIREMQRLDCPFPDDVIRLLILLEKEDY